MSGRYKTTWRKLKHRWHVRYDGCTRCESMEPGPIIQHELWRKHFCAEEFLCFDCMDMQLRKDRTVGLRRVDLINCPWTQLWLQHNGGDNALV